MNRHEVVRVRQKGQPGFQQVLRAERAYHGEYGSGREGALQRLCEPFLCSAPAQTLQHEHLRCRSAQALQQSLDHHGGDSRIRRQGERKRQCDAQNHQSGREVGPHHDRALQPVRHEPGKHERRHLAKHIGGCREIGERGAGAEFVAQRRLYHAHVEDRRGDVDQHITESEDPAVVPVIFRRNHHPSQSGYFSCRIRLHS